MVIGYYVHHSGAGHRTRATVIADRLRARGHEVVLLGSDLDDGDGVSLPRDDQGEGPWVEPTAEGSLHWLPLRHGPTRARMSRLASWVEERRPSAVVVDVSVEVTLLLRLLGVPTVVVAQPGVRDDPAHQLGFSCAQAILAPWPTLAGSFPGLVAHRAKTVHTGGISRLKSRPRPAGPGSRTGVVLGGGNDDGMTALATQLHREVPSLEWVLAGGGSWVDDVEGVLAGAAVVVTHAGQNAVADVAAVGAPAIVVPSDRPHREQEALAAVIDRLGLGLVVPRRQVASAPWSVLVDRAGAAPDRWWTWRTEGAADRAADLIEGVARG